MNQEETIAFAKNFIEDIVSFFGENVKVEVELDGDLLSAKIEDSELSSILIGRNAETLRSLQHLISMALHNNNAAVTHVVLDIADYKKRREEKIAEKARGWIEEVLQTGEAHTAHINAADRRIVHRVAQEYDEIETHSEGEGRNRYIIIAKQAN